MNIKQLNIPQHIAVIMDGNRRWARDRGLPPDAGHHRVADEILEPLIQHAAGFGVKYMTFWAWSTENWQRDKQEIAGIMRIFRHVIRYRWNRLHKKGVKICIIGDISKFDTDIRQSLEKVVEQTKNNSTITTIFALNYGGRDEIIRAIKNVSRVSNVSNVSEAKEAHILDTFGTSDAFDTLTPDTFGQYLDTVGIPDPELIIRTGGEQRLSGFLLWQSEYSELYFPPWFMPDFTPDKLDGAIVEFNKRKRRYGK